MNQLTEFYIKLGDYYLEHYNLEAGHYTMNINYDYRFITNDFELIKRLNIMVNGVIYATHGCDIKC